MFSMKILFGFGIEKIKAFLIVIEEKGVIRISPVLSSMAEAQCLNLPTSIPMLIMVSLLSKI